MRVAAGVVLDGSLRGSGERYQLGRGALVAVSASRQWVRDAWFVGGTVGLGASRTAIAPESDPAAAQHLVATDASLGVTAGRTFARRVSPYLLARGFGGPVLWDGKTGSDVDHYQLGAGASVSAAALTIVVDISVLGAQSASLGLSLRL